MCDAAGPRRDDARCGPAEDRRSASRTTEMEKITGCAQRFAALVHPVRIALAELILRCCRSDSPHNELRHGMKLVAILPL